MLFFTGTSFASLQCLRYSANLGWSFRRTDASTLPGINKKDTIDSSALLRPETFSAVSGKVVLYDGSNKTEIQRSVRGFESQDQVLTGNISGLNIVPELCQSAGAVSGIIHHPKMFPGDQAAGLRIKNQKIRIINGRIDWQCAFIPEGDAVPVKLSCDDSFCF